tara:strand:+ start:2404 stop:2841 length:438 start_codon:yes stop_codon:yes gene_type:complete
MADPMITEGVRRGRREGDEDVVGVPPARIPIGGLNREEQGYLAALRQPYDTMEKRKLSPEDERMNQVMLDLLTKINWPGDREEEVAKIEEEEDEMIALPPEEEEPKRDPFQSFLPPRPRKPPETAPALAEELPEDDEDLILSRLP